MPYIDLEYYNNEYEGVEVDSTSFSRLSKRASEMIDILINHKLTGKDFDKQGAFIKEQIKKATAAQIEYIVLNGEENSIGSGGFGQVSAGNFSYGDKPGKESISRSETMTSQKVMSILSSTGLLYKGLDVYD